MHAITLDQFRAGPGHEKVSFGEYDLYDTTSQIRRMISSDHEVLMPGMSLTMAMRIGLYKYGPDISYLKPGYKLNVMARIKERDREW